VVKDSNEVGVDTNESAWRHQCDSGDAPNGTCIQVYMKNVSMNIADESWLSTLSFGSFQVNEGRSTRRPSRWVANAKRFEGMGAIRLLVQACEIDRVDASAKIAGAVHEPAMFILVATSVPAETALH